MSRSGWLTYSGRFTHISGHPSAAGREQDGESPPVKDRRSTTMSHNKPTVITEVPVSVINLQEVRQLVHQTVTIFTQPRNSVDNSRRLCRIVCKRQQK